METPAAPVCTCTEKCAAGAVNTSCPVCETNLSECAGREKAREPEPEPEPEKKNAGSGLLAVVALLVLGRRRSLRLCEVHQAEPQQREG